MSVSLPAWSAIGFAIFISVLILYRHNSLLRYIYSRAEFAFLRVVVYPRFILYAVIITLFLGVNVLTLSLKATVEQVALRSAIVATGNLIFLLPSPIHRLTNYTGCSLSMQTFLHQCFGWVTIVHGAIHTIVHIASQHPIVFNEQMISGVASVSACCTVGLLCVLFYAGIAYEIFVGSHQILAPGLLAGLWFHIPRGKNLSTLLLGFASLVWAGSKLFQLFTILWSWGTTVSVRERREGYLALQLTQAQPRKFQDGQYFHLIIPRVRLFERHPFMVLRGSEPSELHILVARRQGFTEDLLRVKHGTAAFLDGPFGSTIDFRRYGAVVMFATGMGIVSHIAYIDAILTDHQECRNTTRHISVHWIPDSPVERDLVKPWMDRLVELDFEEGSERYGLPSEQTRRNLVKQYLLNICVYRGGYDDMRGHRNRIQVKTEGLNVEEILDDENRAIPEKCEVAVSVSADEPFRNLVRQGFRKKMRWGSRLFFLDYHPPRMVQDSDKLSLQCRGKRGSKF